MVPPLQMFSTPRLQINCLQNIENKSEAVGVLNQAHRRILFGQQSFKISEVLHFSVSQKNPNMTGSKEQLSLLYHSPHHSLMPYAQLTSLVNITRFIPVLAAFREYNTKYVCIYMLFYTYLENLCLYRDLASLFNAKSHSTVWIYSSNKLLDYYSLFISGIYSSNFLLTYTYKGSIFFTVYKLSKYPCTFVYQVL